MNDREKLRARVRALLAKTVANGCTEEEAVAAAAKAAELMREYVLSEAELDITEATACRESRKRTVRDGLWVMISYVTNCAAILTWDDAGPIVRYYGAEPGPQIAVYLRDICNRAIDAEISAFKKTDVYGRRRKTATRRRAVKDFTHGMADRLAERLYELFRTSISDQQRALAEKARDQANPYANTMKALKPRKVRFDEANHAGWQAGANVGLHHGVDGQGEVRRIGGGS